MEKVAKRMREASLRLYEKNTEKVMPLEYRVVPATPTTSGVVITEMSEAEVRDDDPEPTAGDQNPEVRRFRTGERETRNKAKTEETKKRRNEETLKTCLGRVVEEVYIFVFGVL